MLDYSTVRSLFINLKNITLARCTRKYAKITNENESIFYLDVNSLYVLTCKLPKNLVTRIDELPENWFSWQPDGERCFIVLVDLDHPTL
jgi:hypothetical protein